MIRKSFKDIKSQWGYIYDRIGLDWSLIKLYFGFELIYLFDRIYKNIYNNHQI